MEPCNLPLEVLLDLEEDRLDPEEAARVRAHAAPCAPCRRNLRWLSTFLPALRAAVSGDEPRPSESRLAFARNLARRVPLAHPTPEIALRIARLVFDSRRASLAGARRDETLSAAQRLFETETHFIDLWEEPQADGPVYLIGQAHGQADGSAAAPSLVVGFDQDGAEWPARLEGAEFHFPALPRGTYHFRLHLPEAEVLLVDVEIGG